jgi:ligand-binding sensor domain-containing protein
MKQIITIVLLFLVTGALPAQNILKVTPGTTLKTSGGVVITLQNMDLDNDGTINQASGDGSFRFTGTQSSAIKGSSQPTISILDIAKTNNAKLLLNGNINIGTSINFISVSLI